MAGRPSPLLELADVEGQEQINFQVPFDLVALENAFIQVYINGSPVDSENVPLLRVQPGIFEYTPGATSPGLSTNLRLVFMGGRCLRGYEISKSRNGPWNAVQRAFGCPKVPFAFPSTESPVYGQQEGSAYKGHFESVCYHPLLLFNQHGDCLAARLRPGNVHSAEDWDELLYAACQGRLGGESDALRSSRAAWFVPSAGWDTSRCRRRATGTALSFSKGRREQASELLPLVHKATSLLKALAARNTPRCGEP